MPATTWTAMARTARDPTCDHRVPWAAASGRTWRLLGVQAVLIVALAAALGFDVDGGDARVLATMLAAILLAAVALRRHGFGRGADLVEGSALILVSAVATACLSVLLATLAPPMRDRALASADRLLFPMLSWPAMAHAAAGHPALVGAMSRIYATLLWQPYALVAWLALSGRAALMRRFLHGWVLALVACVAIFCLVPAETPQIHYGFRPGSIPGLTVDAAWRPIAVLGAVRDGTLRHLASGSMAGMVTFPSFHAAGAVLLGWGFWRAGGIGRAMVAVEAAMLTTVPLIGSHYFVDVLGGTGVALLAIRGSREV